MTGLSSERVGKVKGMREFGSLGGLNLMRNTHGRQLSIELEAWVLGNLATWSENSC